MIDTATFKNETSKLLINLRTSKSLTQKKFATMYGLKTSTVNKRESDGILNVVEIFNLCEKMGLDPFEELIELLENAESIKNHNQLDDNPGTE